jgi:hypothetical protein
MMSHLVAQRREDGTWLAVEVAPETCGHGHQLGPGRAHVGFRRCSDCGTTSGGHRTHTCRVCGDVVQTPHCTTTPILTATYWPLERDR